MEKELIYLGIEDTGFVGLDRETGKEKKIPMWMAKFMENDTSEIFQFKIKDRDMKLEYADIKKFSQCILNFELENINNKQKGKVETIIRLESFEPIILK